MKKFIHPALYILSLIACCIEVDISVPSFPDLVLHFHTTESLAQHTVSINFLGFFISALIIGPLSDAYGRRPIMIIGNAILMIGAIGCIFAPTITTLLIARFFQGIGAATSAVIVFAMIADTYTGKKSTQLVGIMNCVLTCLMAASPIVGTYLNEMYGWQGSYAAVAIISIISWALLIFLLPETLAVKKELHFKTLFNDTKTLLTNGMFLQSSIAPSLLYAAYLSFITCAPFLYMQSFELPMYLYALHQALIVTAFACTSLFSGIILKYIGPSKCIWLGLILCVLGTCLFLLASLICPSAALTTAFVSVFAVGFALFYPVVFTASLEVFPNLKGSATSIIMAKRALIIAFFTWTIGCVYNGSPVSISVLMVVISSITFALSYKKNIIFNFL